MVNNIYFDVDGVLADLTAALAAELTIRTGKYVDPAECTDYWAFRNKYPVTFTHIMDEENFARHLPVYEHAQNYVALFNEDYKVYYPTKPYDSGSWCNARILWLMEHFNARRDQIILIHDKYLLSDGLLIDDHQVNVSDWLDFHPKHTGVLWPRRYNSHKREADINDWQNLSNLIEAHVNRC